MGPIAYLLYQTNFILQQQLGKEDSTATRAKQQQKRIKVFAIGAAWEVVEWQ